jgi:hypothetical protein
MSLSIIERDIFCFHLNLLIFSSELDFEIFIPYVLGNFSSFVLGGNEID